MRLLFKLVFLGLYASLFSIQCKTKTSTDRQNRDTTNIQVSKILSATKFDTVSEQLRSKSELMTEDLIALKLVDTTISAQLNETCYCDTTVNLNDSIYYSVISVGDQAGVCSHVFLASIDKKNKKVIGSMYLHPDCDVDYSWDNYELYGYTIISKDKIQLTKTTVFQKKNRTSPNEEENIDHKQAEKNLITISPAGQIKTSELGSKK